MEKPKTTPKDFFLHLGAIIMLYWSAGSLIALTNQLIDYAFPDRLAGMGDPYSAGIKFAIASLVVIFPIFLFVGNMLQKDMATHPEKRDLPIRRWLVYLTLFIASIVIVGDLIALINTFLGGEITTRFTLKTLSILIVAGLIFSYYLSDIRKPETGTRRMKLYATLSVVIVLLSIIFGFMVMGSPSTQRKLRFDAMRVSHLQQIQNQIVEHWRQRESLPQNLGELNDPIYGFTTPVDPKTDTSYEYSRLDENSFELCATFELPTPDLEYRGAYRGGFGYDYSYSMPYPTGFFEDETWKHEGTRTCFTRNIDPEKIPPYEKMR